MFICLCLRRNRNRRDLLEYAAVFFFVFFCTMLWLVCAVCIWISQQENIVTSDNVSSMWRPEYHSEFDFNRITNGFWNQVCWNKNNWNESIYTIFVPFSSVPLQFLFISSGFYFLFHLQILRSHVMVRVGGKYCILVYKTIFHK